MNKITIILPQGALGGNEFDDTLDTFLRQFAEKHKESEGEWADKYGTNFENEKAIMHRFCWCEEETCPYCYSDEEQKVTDELKEKYGMEDEMCAPNFWYKPLNFKVWWYKYIGRGVERNRKLTGAEFKQMVDDCMSWNPIFPSQPEEEINPEDEDD